MLAYKFFARIQLLGVEKSRIQSVRNYIDYTEVIRKCFIFKFYRKILTMLKESSLTVTFCIYSR